MDPLNLGDPYTSMPCSHKFHSKCLLPWLNDHNTCPTCRTALPLESDATPQQSLAETEQNGDETSTSALPYGGNMQAAMAARDHSAVRTLMRHRDADHARTLREQRATSTSSSADESTRSRSSASSRPPSVAGASRSPAASEPSSPEIGPNLSPAQNSKKKVSDSIATSADGRSNDDVMAKSGDASTRTMQWDFADFDLTNDIETVTIEDDSSDDEYSLCYDDGVLPPAVKLSDN
eukprot:SAG31_NODE_3613_length_4067_cov_1.304183_4_plen_235_part_00